MNRPDTHVYQPPADTGLEIIYQCTDLIVLNKPSGLLAVPGRGENKQDSLAWRVQKRLPQARVVHRLDMETSGLMLLALNEDMQRAASLMFQNRQIEKSYIAVVSGLVCDDTGTIDLPLTADWPNRPLQKVDEARGKPCITHYRVIARNRHTQTTRLQLNPQTGRTHQLRLHLQALGHSILGDRLYGDEKATSTTSRLLLHANQLSFIRVQRKC